MSAYRQAAVPQVQVRSCTLSGKIDRPGLYLALAGFVVAVLHQPNAGDVDRVFKTDPDAGTELAKGETVTIYISSGPVSTTTTLTTLLPSPPPTP